MHDSVCRDSELMRIENHGPLIVSTDFWSSDAALAGKLILSPNAGAIRCLLPPALYEALGDLCAAEYAIVSRGPWMGREAVEVLWEDHTDSPYAWHVTEDSCLTLPGDPGGSEWVISCWVERRGEPYKELERPCYWRRVPKLPWLKPRE